MMSHRSGSSKRTGLFWFSSYLVNKHQIVDPPKEQVFIIFANGCQILEIVVYISDSQRFS